jgi:microcin C transport system substrate-binding protein
MSFLRNMAGLLLGSALLCTGTSALAAGSYALTVYGEPPKYAADFKHFDYVDPYAPEGRIDEPCGRGNRPVQLPDALCRSGDFRDPDRHLGLLATGLPFAGRALHRVRALVAEKLERDPEGPVGAFLP